MKRRKFMKYAAFFGALSSTSGCALIFSGAKAPHQRLPQIQWGFFVLNLFFTGLLGLIIDFASGAIYVRKTRFEGPLPEDDFGSLKSFKKHYRFAKKLDLCDDATVTIRAHKRARQSARFLKRHLPHCEACSERIAAYQQAPEYDIASVFEGHGDFHEEMTAVDLSYDAQCVETT